MDFFHLLLPQLWPVLSWLIPAAFVAGLLKTPWAKGHLGELLVRYAAHRRLDAHTYRRLHNVTLPTLDGTTQVDHVFVSVYGIFVLETKNMKGWIFGSEGQAQWTQKFPRRSFRFQNPLRQNFKHLKALETALGVAPEHVHSVITFVGGSTFKTQMPANVTQGGRFVRYIRSFQQVVFSEQEVDALFRALETGRLAPTRATHRAHVDNLKKRSDVSAERKCPRCGNALVVRTRKAGANAGEQFWGCSGFPKCRAVQSL